MQENIHILSWSDLHRRFSPKHGVEWFRAQIAQFVDIPDCLWDSSASWARKHGGFVRRSLRQKWGLLQGEDHEIYR